MAEIEEYEDLRCWQQSGKLVNGINELVEKPNVKNEFELADQLKRAGISVMTNIAEELIED